MFAIHITNMVRVPREFSKPQNFLNLDQEKYGKLDYYYTHEEWQKKKKVIGASILKLSIGIYKF